jgi:hypothetical protein
MNSLDPATRAFLSVTAGCHDPTPADEFRVRRRLVDRLGSAAGLGVSGAVVTQTSSAIAATSLEGSAIGALLGSAKAIVTAKIVAAVLVTGAAGVGGYKAVALVGSERKVPAVSLVAPSKAEGMVERPAVSARPKDLAREQARELIDAEALPSAGTPRSTATAARSTVPASNRERRAVEPTETASKQATPPPAEAQKGVADSPPIATFPSDSSGLAAEARALGLAQAALREGKPEQAYALLAAQAVEFEDGALEEERAAARVVALCKMGHIEAARAAAAEFLRKSPRSVLTDRVKNACSTRD